MLGLALIVVAWLGFVAVVLGIFGGGAQHNACTGNCDQGRCCTCLAKRSGDV